MISYFLFLTSKEKIILILFILLKLFIYIYFQYILNIFLYYIFNTKKIKMQIINGIKIIIVSGSSVNQI